MAYVIEKGIPLPEKDPNLIRARWKKLAADMKVGDSVLVETNSEATALCNALRYEYYKWAARKPVATRRRVRGAGGRDHYRVWRLY